MSVYLADGTPLATNAAMIVYDLTCVTGHRFESWFQSAAVFEAQQGEGAVECPFCGSRNIGRAPMAPHIVRGAPAPAERHETAPGKEEETRPAPGNNGGGSSGSSNAPELPAAMIETLRHLRRHIESNCDYVGPAFPEEARRIFYGESSPRDIYGEASPEDAAALREEGIETQRIPWIPRRDG